MVAGNGLLVCSVSWQWRPYSVESGESFRLDDQRRDHLPVITSGLSHAYSSGGQRDYVLIVVTQ